MQTVFLGKKLHWLLLIAIASVLYGVGQFYLHVVQFNLFVLTVLALACVAVFVVVFGYRPGERVMREPLE
ncbi:MAG: hypothetical protein ACR2RL_11965 [Gammaproteobacteria bacterium]